MQEPNTPVSQGYQGDTQAASPADYQLPGELGGSAPATADDEVKRLKDQLAAQGREAAAARQQAAQAQQAAVQLANELNEVRGYLTEQERRREEAYIRSLPAPQQAEARLRRVEQRLEQPVQQQRPQHQQPSIDEETARRERSAAIVTEINGLMELPDGMQLTGNEPGLDWSDPGKFYQSALKIAKDRLKGSNGNASEEGQVAGKKTNDQQSSGAPAGRALSARPSGGAGGKVTSEEVLKLGENTGMVPRQRKEELQKMRDRAKAQVSAGR